MKSTITLTCNEVLGPRKPNYKGWISTKTVNNNEERKAKNAAVNNSRTRTANVKAHEEFKGVNRNVKRSFKADNAAIWSRWQQRLKRQLIMEICGTFTLP